ncbi:MAG: hypothetical protein LAT54_00560 [Cryomorphaceae bacterium]|nr:hypothetical protein [Cryomorphaceae bacterium]
MTACSANAQVVQPDTIKVFKLRDANAFMSTDHLGGLYIVERNEVTKYPNPMTSKKRMRFSDPQNGEIAHIDAFNPLAILLLYKPFNLIQIVDNQLNRSTANISPEQLNIMDVQLAATSDENTVWIYDQSSDQLHRLNIDRRRVAFQSQIITKLAGREVEPNYLVANMNGVYLNCPEIGILVFDFFGNYKKLIPITGLKRFQVKHQNIVYWQDGMLQLQSIDFPKHSKVTIPGINPRHVRLEDKYLFMQTKDAVVVILNPLDGQ